METDEQNGIIQSTERQRFYIELVPGETTIVSWKKLVKEAAREREREREKEKQYGMEMEMEMESERETEREREREREKQKEREREREREKQKERERERVKNQSVVASIGCESSRICLGGDSDGGQYKDLFFKDLRTEYVDRATSSGHKQQKKQRINAPKIENQTNDDHPSIKHAGPEAVSAKVTDKATDLSNETFIHSTLPAIIKDNQPKKLQAFNVDSPLLTYSKRSACKSEYPPLNAVETASVFPLKKMHDTLPKTQVIEKSAVERSRMKLRIGFDSSDIMHQNLKGRYEPVKINPMLLHDDESRGSRKLIDASPPGYQSFINGSISVLAATEDTLLERPYVKALECAIAELEVAVSRRRSFQSEALDARAPWFVIQRALPPEVMLKFGRVASIVVLRSAKETLSEDLVNRLVTILGKLVHRNTLKKTLRKLVMLNLFMRKGEAERFEDIKTEILSLVCHQQVGAAYIPEAKEKQISGGTYNLDDAAEDKLCDMYELCFQELPQHTDVQVLKLFIELAELWPEVIMDHHKLTKAISRAKKRRAIAEISRGQNVVDDVMTIPDRIPSQKGKVIASTDNHNPITSLPRKTAPKHKNSCPSSTGVKLASKQKRKQLISEKKNVKVKFFMKGEHETANSIEETTKVQANPSSAAASSKGQ
ncbi:ubinuclein-2-like isoform X3 [Amaranthus tricolor]|uniref:ubinuclein-2-like isoform X3 n=1 Tax=Amaranthus tricolor TaxID=29722 RepID=UPI00258DD5A9|nr:ubinuclein-2-like isoform X3 [Amaranthus tricolor]